MAARALAVHMGAEAARCIGADHAATVEEALAGALARVGRDARIGVIPAAGEILPLVEATA